MHRARLIVVRRLFILAGLVLASSPAIPQMLMLNYGASGAAVVVTPPCDLLACTAAYGLRKLKTGATAAIQVIRASDSTTHDVAFTGTNALDEADMLSFCAATNCLLKVVYDQSGNSHNLTSTSGFLMVTAGAVVSTINSHAVALIQGPGSYNAYTTSNFAYCTSTTCAFFGVGQVQSGRSSNCINSSNLFGTTSFTGTYYLGVTTTAATACGGNVGNNSDVAYTQGAVATFTLRYSTADTPKFKVYTNGGTPGTNGVTGGATINDALQLGTEDSNASAAVPANSQFAEWLVFSAEPSLSDSNTVGANQAAYWGLTWGTISQ